MEEVIPMLAQGGFHITAWMSNVREVLAPIPEVARAKPGLDLDIDELPVTRALGLQWNVQEDVFQFKVISQDKPMTKRCVLSTLSSLFDPMGFVCPIILEAKNLMQRLRLLKKDWDDPLPEEERLQWERWLNELSSLSRIEIPRCY
jgi:hypothetical protein